MLLRDQILEEIHDLGFRRVSEHAQQLRDRNLALAVNFAGDNATAIRFDFKPHTALRDDLRSVILRIFRHGREEHTRRAHQLVHHHALNSSNDEGSGISHERNASEEDILLFDFTGLFVDELHVSFHRSLVREVAAAARIRIVFWSIKGMSEDSQLHLLTREIRDRCDFLQQFLESIREEPFVAFQLHFNEGRHVGHTLVIHNEHASFNHLLRADISRQIFDTLRHFIQWWLQVWDDLRQNQLLDIHLILSASDGSLLCRSSLRSSHCNFCNGNRLRGSGLRSFLLRLRLFDNRLLNHFLHRWFCDCFWCNFLRCCLLWGGCFDNFLRSCLLYYFLFGLLGGHRDERRKGNKRTALPAVPRMERTHDAPHLRSFTSQAALKTQSKPAVNWGILRIWKEKSTFLNIFAL